MGFSLSDRPAPLCSILSGFVTLYIALVSSSLLLTDLFSSALSIYFISWLSCFSEVKQEWQGWHITKALSRLHTHNVCVCVVYVGLEPPGRPSVSLIIKTTSWTRTRYCRGRIKSAELCGSCGCFLFFFVRGFGGYSVCPNMCSCSQGPWSTADGWAKGRLIKTHKFYEFCGQSMAYVIYHTG